MTTHPGPGAREIAEKYVSLIFNETVESRDSRVTALAQEIEEYARARLADYRATDNAILELLTGVRSMPLFQEDASDAP